MTTYAYVAPWQAVALPPSGVADYCTLAELKAWLRGAIPSGDTTWDAVLTTIITDASRIVDGLCNLPDGSFVARTLTRTFDVSTYSTGTTTYRDAWGDWYSTGYVSVPPLLSVTSLSTDEDGDGTYEVAWTEGTDYILSPSDGPPYRRVELRTATARYGFPYGQRRVSITGSWGASATVPGPIRRATMLLASRLWKRAEAPFGVYGSPETGVAKIGKVDPDVELILKEAGYMTDSSRWVFV